MAKVTKEEVRICTRQEAHSIIKNADGKIRFMVKLSAFLPTDGNRGFEGITFITVSKKEAAKIVLDLLSETLEGRGGRLRLHMKPAEPDKFYTTASISIY